MNKDAKKFAEAKAIGEMRLQAALVSHQAACLEGNTDLEVKLRLEIHALQDIILDNSSLVIHCLKRESNDERD